MARKCKKCDKSTVFGNRVSHSNRKTRRKWKVNLFSIRVTDDLSNSVKKILLCSRCIRTRGVVKKKSLEV